MEHFDRLIAAQGVFDARALLKLREAYTSIVKALDPDQTFDETQRAEIADALLFLANGKRSMSSVELTVHIINKFSQLLDRGPMTQVVEGRVGLSHSRSQ